ncbi:hypothetical protein Dimus_012538 [Dionaea muscipula]
MLAFSIEICFLGVGYCKGCLEDTVVWHFVLVQAYAFLYRVPTVGYIYFQQLLCLYQSIESLLFLYRLGRFKSAVPFTNLGNIFTTGRSPPNFFLGNIRVKI